MIAELKRDDFDLYHYLSEVIAFADKQRLGDKQTHYLQLVLEELLVNILFPHAAQLSMELGISEENGMIELHAIWAGKEENPMELNDDAGSIARLIVQKRCSSINFCRNSEQLNELRLELSEI